MIDVCVFDSPSSSWMSGAIGAIIPQAEKQAAKAIVAKTRLRVDPTVGFSLISVSISICCGVGHRLFRLVRSSPAATYSGPLACSSPSAPASAHRNECVTNG